MFVFDDYNDINLDLVRGQDQVNQMSGGGCGLRRDG